MISACCAVDFDNLPTNRLVERKRQSRFVEEPRTTARQPGRIGIRTNAYRTTAQLKKLKERGNMSESTYPSVKDSTSKRRRPHLRRRRMACKAWKPRASPATFITDGPHGLRKSSASSTGETDSTTPCPPPASSPAAGLSSPEPGTHPQGRRGDGRGVHPEKVAVITGPGANIKRNPLGGRCFEYWSEDPYRRP